MKTENVTIIGLDRISGSIGLGIQNSELELTIIGSDQDRDVSAQAKEMGAVTKMTNNPVSAAAEADILILNVPSAEHERMFEAIAPVIRDHTLIIDLSRLKGPGQEFASEYLVQGHYVGVIPVLAAKKLTDGRFGIEAAQADLFKQSVFCIMPSPKADPQAVETSINLGRILGASPFFIDSMEYDGLVQGLETAPGLLAAAMFRAVKNSSGWRDMLKFAGLQFSLSTGSLETPDLVDLAFHDKSATLHWMDEVINELREVRRWIADGDKERATLLLDELAYEREKWLLERQRNDWNEIESTDFSGLSIRSQLFGFIPSKKDKKK